MDIYFESIIEIERLDNSFFLMMNSEDIDIQYESVKDTVENIKSFFHKMNKILNGYIDKRKYIHELYKTKKELNRKIKSIYKLCKNNKEIAGSKIRVRGYNKKLIESTDLNEQIQILKNTIATANLKASSENIYSIFKDYQNSRSGWGTFYEIKIIDIPYVYKKLNEDIDNTISTLKSTLYDFSEYLEEDDNVSSIEKKNLISRIYSSLKSSISKKFDIFMMNIEAIGYEVGKTIKSFVGSKHKEYVNTSRNKNKIMKSAKLYKTIKYGDYEYEVYKTNYDHISCFNYKGKYIYLDKGFFDLPKGYQLAILYHEIGHHQCKHFMPSEDEKNNLTVEDEEALINRIKQDTNAFFKYVYDYTKFTIDSYTDGSELLYLLIEWDADRFASKIVGKHLVKNALHSTFNDMLEHDKEVNEYWDKKLLKAFNKERMRIRTSLM